MHWPQKLFNAWGDSGWSPTSWIHWCLEPSNLFCGEEEKYFSIFLQSDATKAWALQMKAPKLLQGLVLSETKFVSATYLHMHHCMSKTALEQGLLGLEVEKASHIDDFV